MLTHFREPTSAAKHTGLDESDTSAESENEGAASDNPSDNNTGSVWKGMNQRFVLVWIKILLRVMLICTVSGITFYGPQCDHSLKCEG